MEAPQNEIRETGTNMKKYVLDIDSLSSEETALRDAFLEKVQKPVFMYENLAEYPPFKLSVNQQLKNEYIELLWSLFYSGNDLLNTQIPDTFDPYAELHKKFSKEIKEARKYQRESGEDLFRALEMYKKDNPSVQIDDNDYR